MLENAYGFQMSFDEEIVLRLTPQGNTQHHNARPVPAGVLRLGNVASSPDSQVKGLMLLLWVMVLPAAQVKASMPGTEAAACLL